MSAMSHCCLLGIGLAFCGLAGKLLDDCCPVKQMLKSCFFVDNRYELTGLKHRVSVHLACACTRGIDHVWSR